MNDNAVTFGNKMVVDFRPQANAVIVTLHEHQGADGTIERCLTYSVEMKDRHLEEDLRRIANELMNLRGFRP